MDMMTAQRQTLRDAFAAARARRRAALVAFVPAGYPDRQATAAVLPALQEGGAGAIEIGFPFSDPIADGPVIQEAFTAALAKKIRVAEIFELIREARQTVTIPMVGMLSYSIVYRYGLQRFVDESRSAGLDGLILPDLPPPEAQRVCDAVRSGGLETVLLVAPTTTPERRLEIARLSTGFVYYLAVSGITGERDSLPADLGDNIRQLRQLTNAPICVGFGLSKPAHVRALDQVADGAIVGTTIVKRMKAHADASAAEIADAVKAYVRTLTD